VPEFAGAVEQRSHNSEGSFGWIENLLEICDFPQSYPQIWTNSSSRMKENSSQRKAPVPISILESLACPPGLSVLPERVVVLRGFFRRDHIILNVY
jgi:hypothetical protein